MGSLLGKLSGWWRGLRASIERGKTFVTHDVWHIGLPGERVPHGYVIKQVRVLILLMRGISDESLWLRASALTFATLLFIVPFLAFMFYLISTLNLGDRVYGAISTQVNDQLARVEHYLRREQEEVESQLEQMEAMGAADSSQRVEVLQENLEKAAEAREHAAEMAEEAREAAVAAEVAEETAEEVAENPDAVEAESETDSRAPPEGEPEEERPSENELLTDQMMETMFPIFAGEGTLGGQQYMDPIAALRQLAQEGASDPQTIGITWLLFVLSTVFGFMRNVETTFNRIWGVQESRKLHHVISSYLLITLLLPVAAAVVLGLTAALEQPQVAVMLGPTRVLLRTIQIAIVCLVFALLYYIIPNTKVRFRYALVGGIGAGLLWTFASWAYVRFQFGLHNNTLFFSTFALFPLLLVWLFVSWMILLFGALISFAYQHEKTFAMERLAEKASYAYREAIAVRIVVELSRRFRHGQTGYTVTEMAEAWNVPTRVLNDALTYLQEGRLVVAVATEPPCYQPARAPETMCVKDVTQALRESGRDPSLLRRDRIYRGVYDGLNEGDDRYLKATIAEMADEIDAAEAEEKETGKAPDNTHPFVPASRKHGG